MRVFFALILVCAIFALSTMGVEAKSGLQCNCVKYGRSIESSLPLGLNNKANKKKIVNSLVPIEGGFVLTSEGYWGHVAYIEKVEGTWFYILEANYKHCQVSYRWLQTDYSKIYGYYIPPVVLAKQEMKEFMAKVSDQIIATIDNMAL